MWERALLSLLWGDSYLSETSPSRHIEAGDHDVATYEAGSQDVIQKLW